MGWLAWSRKIVRKIMIKLLVCDIDGVLTDGKKYYDNNGNCVLKSFNDKDWTGLKKFLASGIKVILLSGDKNINEIVTNNRNFTFCFSGKQSKLDYIKKFGIDFLDIVYIGDDIFDYELMLEVGCACCPKNSAPEILQISRFISSKKGGDGVIQDIYEILSDNKLISRYDMKELLKFDAMEKM
jgi:3-deoxy-D-manno-octulosonate 8-phosphate phosphatase (KDO 8-P phosphatase)